MSQYRSIISTTLNDMLSDKERVKRCPEISQTVTKTICDQANALYASQIPPYVPGEGSFRQTALEIAYDECVHEVHPYVKCQCANSNISLSTSCPPSSFDGP